MGKIKVLLTQDVEKLGTAGDVKRVAGGFGRNYLIPKGFAVLATPGAVKQAEERLGARRRREQAARRDAEAVAARLNGLKLQFVERVGELDRLYGSVTSADIAAAIKAATAMEIDRRKIILDDPIKRIGVYPVQVRLAADLIPVLNVVVEAAEGTGSGAAAPAAEDTADETEEAAEPAEPSA